MSQTPPKLKNDNIVGYLNHPLLKRYVKVVPAGQYLFRQGDMGNTMFIVIDGTVWLMAQNNDEEHVAGVLERGQFLGEKSVMGATAHKRFFSALAKSHTTVLELRLEDIDVIQEQAPEVMIDILRRMFLVAAERLDRANYMVRLLRSSNNVQRLLELILYYANTAGRTVPEGVEFVLTDDSIHHHVDMKKDEIEECITELVRAKVLKRVVNNYFTLKDPKALVDYGPKLYQHLQQMRGYETKGGFFSFLGRR